MAIRLPRRLFLALGGAGVLGLPDWRAAHASAMALQEPSPKRSPGKGKAVVVSSANGLKTVSRGMELIQKGIDPLDAAVAGIALVEADPEDHTVGLGGIPNEDGVVELDSAVMHGPTHRGGAVASLRNIVHSAAVAKLVME